MKGGLQKFFKSKICLRGGILKIEDVIHNGIFKIHICTLWWQMWRVETQQETKKIENVNAMWKQQF